MLVLLVGGWISVRAAVWDGTSGYPNMPFAQELAGQFALDDGTSASAQSEPEIGGAIGGAIGAAPQSQAYSHYGQTQQNGAPTGYGGRYGGYYAGDYAGPHPGPLTGTYPYPPAQAAYPQVVYYVPHPDYAARLGQARHAPPHGRAPQGPLAHPGFAPAPYQTGLPNALRPFPLAPGLPQGWSANDAAASLALLDQRGGTQEARPPYGTPQLGLPAQPQRPDRLFLDVYTFYRQGSRALSVPQTRSPIYGASQLAANLQWRAKPSSSLDPRIYARAYQALVTGGESELALGVSGLPIKNVPVRAFGELRATRNPQLSDQGVSSKTSFRPAAYVATELAPQSLPLGFSLDAYGAAGYVAGNSSTYFLDGQAIATREVTRFRAGGFGNAALSVGGGVWGGAQKDAQRVDIGPTLRLDFDLGKVPARVSVDYREKVAGDAEPDSGVAATVSTRF